MAIATGARHVEARRNLPAKLAAKLFIVVGFGEHESARRTFHRNLGLETGDITIDRGDSEHAPGAFVPHQTILRADIAVDRDFVPFLGVTDIVDRHVVMLAPEERHGIEHFALPEHVARGGLALPFRHHPMFDANGFAGMPVWPARDIAGRIDAGNAGFEIGIDLHTAIDRKPGLFGERQARPHADADHDDVCLDHTTALQRGTLAVDCVYAVPE